MNMLFTQLSSVFKDMFQWWVLLAPWEQALRVRRGKTVKKLGGGIHFRIPLLDRFFVQSVRLRITDCPLQTITTLDGKTITLKAQLGYRIENLKLLYDTLHDAEGTVMNIVQMIIADHVCANDVQDLLPLQIAEALQLPLTERLALYGLGGVNLSITDFAIVKTYRLITQDIWVNSGRGLDTFSYHGEVE